MKTGLTIVSLFAWCLVSLPGAASPASLGGKFADVYTAFAPLYSFYRSYADYLFYGSEVVVPSGIGVVCQSFSSTLASLQMDLIVQTESGEAINYVVHLRQSLGAFCARYSETITAVATMTTPDMEFLGRAAKKGFFGSISELNNLLKEAFNAVLEKLPAGKEQWKFAAAFACRTLIDQPRITHIEDSLKKILLGSDESPPPPSGLPDEIVETLHELAAYAGQDVTPTDVNRVKGLAHKIYNFLLATD